MNDLPPPKTEISSKPIPSEAVESHSEPQILPEVPEPPVKEAQLAKHVPPDKLKKPAEFLEVMLEAALELGASDIHVEPQNTITNVRFRVDGDMFVWDRYHKKQMESVIARIKFLCGIDFAITDKIAEGRFSHVYNDQPVHFRLSVIPTPNGQDLVLRILSTGPQFNTLEEAGLPPFIAEDFRRCMWRKNGLILVTGATGSGKTTTLFAGIREVNDGKRKILTVEDPIEYKIPGITQVRLHQKLGLSYAAVLKTSLRHDPDVILIGETRDLEAAQIAVQASMTGHLVLTTLHTNSALSSIMRLLNLGVEPVDISNSLTAAYSQHLLRKLCPHCKVKIPFPEESKRLIPEGYTLPADVYEPQGCDACHGLGFKGRVPLAELVVIDDDIREVIIQKPTLGDLKKCIKNKGIKDMLQNGLDLAGQGLVTVDAVLRSSTG